MSPEFQAVSDSALIAQIASSLNTNHSEIEVATPNASEIAQSNNTQLFTQQLGLVPSHAYAVTGIVTDPSTGAVTAIVVANPWGKDMPYSAMGQNYKALQAATIPVNVFSVLFPQVSIVNPASSPPKH